MKYTVLTTLLFIFTIMISPLSQASSFSSSSYIQLAQANQNLNDAVQSVKQQTGGRILSAKTVNINGKRIHKIKVLLPSGQVQVFSISAD